MGSVSSESSVHLMPPARSSIDWDSLGTSVLDHEINGHVESIFNVKTGGWSRPNFVKDPYIKVHGLSPALNYGQQAYEGLKAYRDSNGRINVFRAQAHAARFSHSASYVSIPPIPTSHFLECVNTVVALNAALVPPYGSKALLYIRPLVFGSSGHLGLTPPSEYTLAVYVQPVNSYHGIYPVDALVLEDFDRAAPRGTGSAKVGGNYAPVIRWSDKARSEGYPITLHLDAATRMDIEEFSTSGFVGVKIEHGESRQRVTLVVPDSQNIVQSVTSDTCCVVAKSLGWIVEKRAIPWTEVSTFSEVMAVGTAAAIVPIKSITRRSTNETISYGDKAGVFASKLYESLINIMTGEAEDFQGWLVPVTNEKLQ